MKDKSRLRINEATSRFTDDEFELLKWQAEKLNMSISQFIRLSTVKMISEIREAGNIPPGFL